MIILDAPMPVVPPCVKLAPRESAIHADGSITVMCDAQAADDSVVAVKVGATTWDVFQAAVAGSKTAAAALDAITLAAFKVTGKVT